VREEEHKVREQAGLTMRKTHVAGVQFPIAEDAVARLEQLSRSDQSSQIGLVQLTLDTKGERIDLLHWGEAPEPLGGSRWVRPVLPTNQAAFTFFRWTDGRVVFVYSFTGDTKLRDKMLFASTRAAVLDKASSLGVVVVKRVRLVATCDACSLS
jgi:hypothetical protein